MRGLHLVGVILLVMGIAMAATTGSSFEKRKMLLNAQNVDIPLKQHSTNAWPWLAGTIAVIGGVAIFLLKSHKRP